MNISVCAPYWQRQDALDGMVEHFNDMYPDLNLEISIADDGSPTPAQAPMSPYHRIKITHLPLKLKSLNPCVPINRAVNASSGDVIVLTNPEVRHKARCLVDALLLHKEAGPTSYVTVPCQGLGYGVEPFWLAGPEVDYSKHGRLPVPPGAHFHFLAVFSRELWELAGGFDEDYRRVLGCDDNDWLWRAHAVGATFLTSEGMVTQPKGTSAWKLPHGSALFRKKWPEAFLP